MWGKSKMIFELRCTVHLVNNIRREVCSIGTINRAHLPQGDQSTVLLERLVVELLDRCVPPWPDHRQLDEHHPQQSIFCVCGGFTTNHSFLQYGSLFAMFIRSCIE